MGRLSQLWCWGWGGRGRQGSEQQGGVLALWTSWGLTTPRTQDPRPSVGTHNVEATHLPHVPSCSKLPSLFREKFITEPIREGNRVPSFPFLEVA